MVFSFRKMQTCCLFMLLWHLLLISAKSTEATLADTSDITNDTSLHVSPTSIFPGLTRQLMLNCTFATGAKSNFSDVMSLIISKTSSVDDDVFNEIADLTSRSHDNAEVKGTLLNVKASGHLPQQQGEAFLLLEWTDPTAAAEGHYRCQAFGMDFHGHPKVSSSEATVLSEVEFTPQVLLHELKSMHQSQDELQALKNELNNFKQKCESVENEVNLLKNFKSNITTNLFAASSMYGGHQYLLSMPMVRDIANSDNICRMFGGYIVEINDQAEYNFVYDFAFVKNHVQELVIGVSDGQKEGTFKYLYSGSTAWLDKKNDAPGGKGQDCIEIWTSGNTGRMVDEPCTGVNNRHQYVSRFMCEMPQRLVNL